MATIPLISSRAVARGNGWQIDHVICRSGPQNDSYEERHERVSIAAVVRGSFSYRCDAGRSLMHPGSLMLGNAGSCFECGHEHGAGDVCVAVHIDQSLFEEISSSSAGTSRFRFGLPSLSASNELLQSLVELGAYDRRPTSGGGAACNRALRARGAAIVGAFGAGREAEAW